MSGDGVTVAYEIATDPSLRKIVARGTAFADPRYGYSVHVEITGLQPGRPYWYRFMSGDATSRIGRSMTRPPQGAPVERVNFGFVSCSNYEHGYFSAYRHLADEQPDFVLFLGDYIYEYPDARVNELVRRHSEGVETTTLAAYRNRYAQYRTDPDLQRLHAETTALMTWDDHEVQNDYANQWSQTFDDPQRFLMRRAAGYQAYYEHMPVRAMSRPAGPAMRVYDRFGFGDLLEISLIDGRQYRSREACYGRPDKGRAHLETVAGCPERAEQSRTMLGAQQESWLFDGFADRARAGTCSLAM
jgi:alkaline phosphatase D